LLAPGSNCEREELVVKKVIALGAVLGVLVAIAPTAFAGNAHFIKSATSASLSGSSLVCTFKEAGLQSGSTETVTCSATATTTYECVNNGGKNPSASNKTTRQTAASGSGEFTADRNGNISGSVTISPPSAADLGFSCPSGQTVTFVSVSYTGVTLTDEDSGAAIAIAGTFTFTNPDAP
jgi:hypothetical protein